MTHHPYSYTILQYRHDVWTGEALNLGVFLHCPSQKYSKLLARYGRGRISRAYPDLDPSSLREMVQALERRIERDANVSCGLDSGLSANKIGLRLLKDDESSLRWHTSGTGITKNAAEAHLHLFSQYVTAFDKDDVRSARSDQQVFETLKPKLEEAKLLYKLQARTLPSRAGPLTFDHTYQNGILHCVQPLSLDLADADRMQDKAARWVGKMHALTSVEHGVKFYFVTGRPRSDQLMGTYYKMKDFLLSAPSEVSPLVVDEKDGNQVVDALLSASRH